MSILVDIVVDTELEAGIEPATDVDIGADISVDTLIGAADQRSTSPDNLLAAEAQLATGTAVDISVGKIVRNFVAGKFESAVEVGKIAPPSETGIVEPSSLIGTVVVEISVDKIG